MPSNEPTIPRIGNKKVVLPPPDTVRWSSRRKAAVVVATRAGAITREEARQRYVLSNEELAGWEAAFDKNGVPGLRVTRRHPQGAAPLTTRRGRPQSPHLHGVNYESP
jgi:Protein of unknown function (DUF1153)